VFENWRFSDKRKYSKRFRFPNLWQKYKVISVIQKKIEINQEK